jgi:LmbE family N-acetylglucosaminyl deacetylase
LVLTHYRHDLHQDHRVIGELTWNTFRSHLILEYEIPKYDGDLGAPNFFVGLDRETCKRKADYICRSFASQRDKQWFTAETFLALQRLRGVESNAPHGFAEGFHCRKFVL